MAHKATFDEFFTHVYLPHAKASKRSWALDERLALRHLSPHFGSCLLGDIRSEHIMKWLSSMRAKGLAASSCNRILAVLKSLFTLAIRLEYLPCASSPCKDIKLLRVAPRPERYLSRDEGRRLLAHLRTLNKPESRIIQLLLLTGARKGEIRQAKWENLDFEHHILTVPLSKSGRPGRIYLSEDAISLLKSIAPKADSPWIFPGRNSQKPISDIYRFWNKIRRTLGLGDVRIHDLRHSFASFLVSEGHSLYVAQHLLGHVDPRTTMRYAHFARNGLIEAAASVMHILRGEGHDNRTMGLLTGEEAHSGSRAILEENEAFGRGIVEGEGLGELGRKAIKEDKPWLNIMGKIGWSVVLCGKVEEKHPECLTDLPEKGLGDEATKNQLEAGWLNQYISALEKALGQKTIENHFLRASVEAWDKKQREGDYGR